MRDERFWNGLFATMSTSTDGVPGTGCVIDFTCTLRGCHQRVEESVPFDTYVEDSIAFRRHESRENRNSHEHSEGYTDILGTFSAFHWQELMRSSDILRQMNNKACN